MRARSGGAPNRSAYPAVIGDMYLSKSLWRDHDSLLRGARITTGRLRPQGVFARRECNPETSTRIAFECRHCTAARVQNFYPGLIGLIVRRSKGRVRPNRPDFHLTRDTAFAMRGITGGDNLDSRVALRWSGEIYHSGVSEEGGSDGWHCGRDPRQLYDSHDDLPSSSCLRGMWDSCK
jgi:hypothetical protein